MADILNARGEVETLRALIVPGSDDNYIVEKHVKNLKLEMISSYQNISVLGDYSGARLSLRSKYISFPMITQ